MRVRPPFSPSPFVPCLRFSNRAQFQFQSAAGEGRENTHEFASLFKKIHQRSGRTTSFIYPVSKEEEEEEEEGLKLGMW